MSAVTSVAQPDHGLSEVVHTLQCPECCYQTLRLPALQEHYRHSHEKFTSMFIYSCPICRATATDVRLIAEHKSIYHQAELPPNCAPTHPSSTRTQLHRSSQRQQTHAELPSSHSMDSGEESQIAEESSTPQVSATAESSIPFSKRRHTFSPTTPPSSKRKQITASNTTEHTTTTSSYKRKHSTSQAPSPVEHAATTPTSKRRQTTPQRSSDPSPTTSKRKQTTHPASAPAEHSPTSSSKRKQTTNQASTIVEHASTFSSKRKQTMHQAPAPVEHSRTSSLKRKQNTHQASAIFEHTSTSSKRKQATNQAALVSVKDPPLKSTKRRSKTRGSPGVSDNLVINSSTDQTNISDEVLDTETVSNKKPKKNLNSPNSMIIRKSSRARTPSRHTGSPEHAKSTIVISPDSNSSFEGKSESCVLNSKKPYKHTMENKLDTGKLKTKRSSSIKAIHNMAAAIISITTPDSPISDLAADEVSPPLEELTHKQKQQLSHNPVVKIVNIDTNIKRRENSTSSSSTSPPTSAANNLGTEDISQQSDGQSQGQLCSEVRSRMQHLYDRGVRRTSTMISNLREYVLKELCPPGSVGQHDRAYFPSPWTVKRLMKLMGNADCKNSSVKNAPIATLFPFKHRRIDLDPPIKTESDTFKVKTEIKSEETSVEMVRCVKCGVRIPFQSDGTRACQDAALMNHLSEKHGIRKREPIVYPSKQPGVSTLRNRSSSGHVTDLDAGYLSSEDATLNPGQDVRIMKEKRVVIPSMPRVKQEMKAHPEESPELQLTNVRLRGPVLNIKAPDRGVDIDEPHNNSVLYQHNKVEVLDTETEVDLKTADLMDTEQAGPSRVHTEKFVEEIKEIKKSRDFCDDENAETIPSSERDGGIEKLDVRDEGFVQMTSSSSAVRNVEKKNELQTREERNTKPLDCSNDRRDGDGEADRIVDKTDPSSTNGIPKLDSNEESIVNDVDFVDLITNDNQLKSAGDVREVILEVDEKKGNHSTDDVSFVNPMTGPAQNESLESRSNQCEELAGFVEKSPDGVMTQEDVQKSIVHDDIMSGCLSAEIGVLEVAKTQDDVLVAGDRVLDQSRDSNLMMEVDGVGEHWQCELCFAGFEDRDELNSHLREIHNDL